MIQQYPKTYLIYINQNIFFISIKNVLHLLIRG